MLHEWVEDNDNNLNPNEDTMSKLVKLTSVTYDQVSAWFAYQRRQSPNIVPKIISPEAVEVLEAFFRTNRYPNRNDKDRLTMELGITKRQLTAWFYKP